MNKIKDKIKPKIKIKSHDTKIGKKSVIKK
jgi:hypothetical protein